MPQSLFKELEQFVDEFYNSIISIPDIEDSIDRNMNFNYVLTISNVDEIMEEMKLVSHKFLGT